MTQHPDHDLPGSFTLPPLPAALDAWFTVVADLGDDAELIYDGAVLDNLGVVDREAARLALVGYRFVFENGVWADAAANGSWQENWIVLDSINADPIIADVSTPDVCVLLDRHGLDRWEPHLVADTLAEFLVTIERVDDVPGPPAITEPLPAWSVWAIDLGPSPMKTLVALAKWPLFPPFDRAELLQLRGALPAQLASGLTEQGARSCVDFGARTGAVFEARTTMRGDAAALAGVDLDGLWAHWDRESYSEPAPSDQLIASIEEEIGFRLPDAYIALARVHNGGPLARGIYPMTEPTGWADDHIAVTGIYSIGRTSRNSLCGDLGATFMRDEWGYPDWGIGIADTPTAGHEQIMLDYRECGPTGEPRVVYVDQEADYAVVAVAPDFASFLRGLISEDQFEEN